MSGYYKPILPYEDCGMIKEEDLDPVLAGEEGDIARMVESLEASYQMSCQHNGTTPDDHAYFRNYVFFCIAQLGETSRHLAKALDNLMDKLGVEELQ